MRDKHVVAERKRALFVATTASMIDQFNRENIKLLQSMDYEVHIMCNFQDGNTTPEDVVKKFRTDMEEDHVKIFDMPFTRSPFAYGKNLRLSLKLRKIIKKYKYQIIHCQTPVGGVIARIAASFNISKWNGRIIYMAHGFHFFKGAPKKNWLMFYPVEWLFSWVTDTLITINKEDYCLAHKHFHAKHIAYVPGVGIDTAKFFVDAEAVKITRKKLGMGEDNILLLSVGEVNDNKNHIIVIQALAKLKNEKIHYFICGVGDKTNQLKMLAQKEGIGHQVHFLGFREDIRELCSAADLFIFPSKREGLPVSLMEAIACHVPVLCSRVRGNVDLVRNKNCLFEPTNIEDVVKCLQFSLGDGKRSNIMENMNDDTYRNYDNLQKYTLNETEKKIKKIYVNKF